MLHRLLLIVFLFFYFQVGIVAQANFSHLRISLLTCEPGKDLYSTFGHSALRITDSVSRDDIVFNYGTFDFNEPGFYTKFIRGKLTFYLSTENFDSFRAFYQQDNRGITEQVLNLSSMEKNRVVRLLQNNLNGANKFYKYDFTFDNCTTRLRDLLEKAADTTIIFGQVLLKKTRFRQLIYEYLNYSDNQWSKLGIDLLLGSKTDAVMTNRQVMFLPDYLLKTLNRSKIANKPLVLSTHNLFTTLPKNNDKDFITHPETIFTLFFLLVATLSFSKNKVARKLMLNFDGALFFLAGLMGVLILVMWFGTDHVMCSNNYNLLWAWPLHTIMAFYINIPKAQTFTKNYFKLTALINFLLLLLWFFLPQHLNISLMPIVLVLLLRSAIIGYNVRGVKLQ